MKKHIDLQSFCLISKATIGLRQVLTAPYSDGKYTYASNSHYLIRVPGCNGVVVPEELPKIDFNYYQPG